MNIFASGVKPIIIIDSREQKPYAFRSCASCAGYEIKKLDYGDYQLKDLPKLIVIERKQNMVELAGNLGKGRDRFERELTRMRICKFKFVIVEDYYSSIWNNLYGKMNPNAMFESIIALELKYDTRFKFVGKREMGHKITCSLLLKAFKYYMEGKIKCDQ